MWWAANHRDQDFPKSTGKSFCYKERKENDKDSDKRNSEMINF